MFSGEPMAKERRYQVKFNSKWEKDYPLDKLIIIPMHFTVYHVNHGCVVVKSRNIVVE